MKAGQMVLLDTDRTSRAGFPLRGLRAVVVTACTHAVAVCLRAHQPCTAHASCSHLAVLPPTDVLATTPGGHS